MGKNEEHWKEKNDDNFVFIAHNVYTILYFQAKLETNWAQTTMEIDKSVETNAIDVLTILVNLR